MATASLLAGCSNIGRAASGTAGYAATSFTAMAAPTDAAAMATTTVGSVMNVHFSDDTVRRYKLAYQPFFLTGTEVPKQGGGIIVAGGYYDIHNKPIMDTSGATPRQYFSDSPDGTSLLALPNPTVPGIKGKAVFAVVQFEYTSSDAAGKDIYGQLPSPIAVLTLDQDQSTGKLTLVQYHNVDTSGVHGLWITCGASLSPWGTHLSSEEYEPNVPFLDAPAGNRNNTSPYFNSFSLHTFKAAYGTPGGANPYHYGHVPEVTVHPDGSGSIKKHYCLGRISHELIQVMPDERTVLMGDDYTNGGLFMFVADRKKDLSAGTLYVAKLTSSLTLDTASAGATLGWIKLGHATSDEIEALIDSGIRLDDFMHVTDTDMRADPGYTKIFADKNANWVKLVDPADARLVKAAAFLETHRYANLKGASMGFTKLEGTTVNIKDKIAYSALQNIQDSMIAGHAANRPETNIALPQALRSGGVFAHDLAGGQHDTDGAAIDSEWVPARTRALLLGEDIAADALGNKSNPDKIGNPDNLKFSEKMRTLFIGEDSSRHTNNFLWAYHVDTGKLSRLMSLPAGAESTGLHAVDEINGWTYIMSNFQHPGEGTAKAAIADKRLRADVVTAIDQNYGNKYQAAVGYLTADPLQPKLS
ncbi:alkaline phosphatase [Oxalicibacterium solurbis]|uniref:Alkaline phosphatase n=2 Tax=Oxalicibacterium solurbis TaxID=69280 RepID=A0A8J3FA46_9BURK|nr:alkaline phosphatase [Oxalicibacterium solurbis]